MASFKDWYALNGDLLNAQRRERYHTDPSYRKMVQERNQEYKQATKKGPLIENVGNGRVKTQLMYVNGRLTELRLYSSGCMLESLGIKLSSFCNWEKKGLVPRTPFVDEKGSRWYTEEMISELRTILHNLGKI